MVFASGMYLIEQLWHTNSSFILLRIGGIDGVRMCVCGGGVGGGGGGDYEGNVLSLAVGVVGWASFVASLKKS